MKTLQRLVLVGLSILALSLPGCKEYKVEYSEVKHETARVTIKDYKEHFLNPLDDLNPLNELNPLKVALKTKYYWITFDGKIDFELNNKEIFDRFKLEDKANVSYKEIHGKTYGRDGETRYLEKDEIVGNEFVDAWPIK